MSWLKKLFGGGDGGDVKPGAAQEYKGYAIAATPIKESGQWRLAGHITKEIGGVAKEHKFVRADLFSSKEEAEQFAFVKAQLIIDQSGEGMFPEFCALWCRACLAKRAEHPHLGLRRRRGWLERGSPIGKTLDVAGWKAAKVGRGDCPTRCDPNDAAVSRNFGATARENRRGA